MRKLLLIITLISLSWISNITVSVALDSDLTLAQCTQTVLETKKFREYVCDRARVRLGGMKPFKGNRLKSADEACIKAQRGYAIIGTPEVKEKTCYGGRCSHDDVVLTYNRKGNKLKKACVKIYGWIEDKYFGGGAKAVYDLCATVERPFSTEDIIEIIKQCEEAVGP